MNTAAVTVKLVGGPCDGWTVEWPDGKDFEYFTIASERESSLYTARTEPELITFDAQSHMYVLTPGREGKAHYARPLSAAELDVMERRIADDIGVELEPMDDDDVRRGLDLDA